MVRADLNLLHLAAQVLEANIDEMQLLGVVSIVEEFERGLLQELDFHQELSNLLEFQRNLDPTRKVVVPRRTPTLVADRVDDAVLRRPADPQADSTEPGSASRRERNTARLVQAGVRGWRFHGDPHAGNVLYGIDGRVCLLDLGMVGRVSETQRDDMVALVVARSPTT